MTDLTTDEAIDALDRAVDRFCTMLVAAPNDGTRQVPPLTWNIREVALHVLSGLRAYRDRTLGGSPAWNSLATSAEDNDRMIAATSEEDLTAIASAIPDAAKQFAEACASRGDAMVPWHEDIVVPASVVAGLSAGEVLVHGRDVAQALGTPWPIERRDAALVTAAALYVVPHFVDERAAAGFTATYELRLRGAARYTIQFADGALTTASGAAPRAECRISADPEAFLLVSYGRSGLAKPIATAKMLSWGRKPWLALRLPRLLRNP